MTRGFLAFLSCALLSGCVTMAQFAPSKISQNYPKRTPPDQIELYRTQTPVKKYVEIGAVSACCNSVATNKLIDLLRSKASDVGGDAIIGLDIDPTGGVTASVIRYQ